MKSNLDFDAFKNLITKLKFAQSSLEFIAIRRKMKTTYEERNRVKQRWDWESLNFVSGLFKDCDYNKKMCLL